MFVIGAARAVFEYTASISIAQMIRALCIMCLQLVVKDGSGATAGLTDSQPLLAAATAIGAVERAGFTAGRRSGAAAHLGAGAGRVRANRKITATAMAEPFKAIGV